MLEKLRADLRAKLSKRAELHADMNTLLEAVEAEDRSELSEDETAKFAELRESIDAIDAEIEPLEARVAELADLDARAAEAAEVQKRLGVAPQVETPEVRVTSEPLTYRDGGDHSFIRDAFAAEFGMDYGARDRLARHQREMEVEHRSLGREFRDVGTSAFAGLVVPQYLTDLYAPDAKAGRVFANQVRSLPLPPDGMTVNISRITTATAVASQTQENANVSETDIDDTLLTVNVRTIAGQQDVSRQALDRGTMIDAVIMADLMGEYAAELDRQCINGSGSSGEHTGVLGTSGKNLVTYTDTTATVAEAYPKIADAVQQIASNRYLGANAVFMHPRRWGWFLSAVDGSQRPLVVPAGNGPQNAYGVGDGNAYGFVGSIAGLPVYTDANIPTTLGASTNEDRIIVCRTDDIFLWEDSSQPLGLRFDATAPGSLRVKMVLFGYSAFTAGRYPAAVSVIKGTGLTTPSF